MAANVRGILIGVALLALSAGVQAATATRTSSFAYNSGTGLINKEVIEPDTSNLCLVTTYGYDGFGNKTSVQTRNCNASTGEAAAPTGDYAFTARTSGNGYDAQGRFATTATNAAGHIDTRVYDTRFGTTTSLTGPNSLTTTWAYDALGRKTLETRSDGNKTQFDYLYCSGVNGGTAACPANAKYVMVTTPKNSAGTANGAVSKAYFDALNREVRSETEGFSGTLVYKDTQYDTFGRVSQASRPYYNGSSAAWTVYTYDELNRVVTEIQPAATGGTIKTTNGYNGLTTTATVNNNGSTTNMPEAVSQVRTTVKNSQGQAVSVTDTKGFVISYTYDPFGNVLTTNAGGVATTLGYDLRGRKTSLADLDMGAWTYVVDPLGQMRRQTDAKAQVTTNAYDLLGRLTNRTEPSLTSNWTYDSCTKGVGKLCNATSNNGYSRQLQYEAQGRLSSITSAIDAPNTYVVSYAYNADGRLFETTYPTNNAAGDVKVRNVYNTRGYLTSVTNTAGGAYWTANTVSATGKVLTETLGNGAITTNTYDALDRMLTNVVAKTAVNLQSFSYNYDTIGNLTQRIDGMQGNLTENVAYDSLNRVLQTSGAGLTTKSYGYSSTGNLTSKSDAGTYTYLGSRPHAVSSITGTVNGYVNPSFTYDANGNMSTGLGRTFTYTSFNMPATITGGRLNGGTSYTYTYTYNSDHERVRLQHSALGTFIYVHPDGKGALLYEKEVKAGTGLIEHKNYIMAGGRQVGVILNRSNLSPTEVRYFHQDRLGSVTTITNASGGVTERLAYDAFGKRRNPNGTDDPNNTLLAINTDRGYTGHEHLDEVALVHMNGRIYDPVLGRFTSADPFVDQADNLQDYNRYSYVNNNPFMYTDPTGYFKLKQLWRPALAIAAAIMLQPEISFALISSAVAEAGAALTLEGLATIVTVSNATASAVSGFAAGMISGGGDTKAGLQGALSGALFSLAGTVPGADSPGRYAAHAAAGCAQGAMSGGGCARGAASAFAGKYVTNMARTWEPTYQMAATVVAGGTASAIGGGKFGNGAVTAAFGYVFNQMVAARAAAASAGARGAAAGGLGVLARTRAGEQSSDNPLTTDESRASSRTDEERTHATYIKRGPNGEYYMGRTSGFGTPEAIVAERDAGHHMNKLGYGPAVLDKSAQGFNGYLGIRGREQDGVDYYGGVGSSRVGNSINPIWPHNPLGPIYKWESQQQFGNFQGR